MRQELDRSGAVHVSWLRAGVLELVFSGHVTASTVDHALDMVIRLCHGVTEPHGCLFSTEGVTGFDASVTRPGGELLSWLKSRGVVRAVAITPKPAVRMIGIAINLGLGLSMDFFADRSEAAAAIAAL